MLPVVRTAPSVIPVISQTLLRFMPRIKSMASNPLVQAVGFAEVIDAVQEMTGGASTPEEERGIEEISKAIAHLLNDPNIIVPESRNGEELALNYLTIDLKKGRAWFHPQYYSRKSINAASRRGFGRGRRGRNARVRGEVSV